MRFFVSYSKQDADRVRKKKADLEKHGHSVWMDDDLTPGVAWENQLKVAIKTCDRALIFLSNRSTSNHRYQQNEINSLIELSRSRAPGFLVPIRLEKCPIPQGLKELHALDSFESRKWRAWLTHLLPESSEIVPRPHVIPVAGRSLPLPVFFPSLSTAAKTTISVPQHVELLLSLSQPQFLVSAADIYNLRQERQKSSRLISELVTRAGQNGQMVLLDSGNYERFWQKLDRWSRARFHEVLSYVPVQLAFCYDNLSPAATVTEIVREIEMGAAKDRKAADLEALLPIVHCPKPEMFPEVCAEIVNRMHPLMIGVPERELGVGLVERIDTVAAIRDAINKTGTYCPLHLLGTGNPISLVLFAIAGADSFDGLEWCQTSVDYETYSLHHLSHMEVFWHQSNLGSSYEISPAARALTHNLLFYQDLMPRIGEAIKNGTVEQLAQTVCGEAKLQRLLGMSEGLRKSLKRGGIK